VLLWLVNLGFAAGPTDGGAAPVTLHKIINTNAIAQMTVIR